MWERVLSLGKGDSGLGRRDGLMAFNEKVGSSVKGGLEH